MRCARHSAALVMFRRFFVMVRLLHDALRFSVVRLLCERERSSFVRK